MASYPPQGKFDIPDVPDWVPRRLKPWIFILFVLIIQFSGSVYLAAVSNMAGTTALMQNDILMCGYAQLCGMAINFCVMFRIKFRFSNQTVLLVCCMGLIAANIICSVSDSMPVLVATCYTAGWLRMQATFQCNSTIQLWLTPKRDMSVFFCYVYLVVDGAIQLSGLLTVYASYIWQWQYVNVLMTGLLALMMVLVIVFVRTYWVPLHIPLLGIDWIGSLLWSGFMLGCTFICVYGDYFDWFESAEICGAAVLVLGCISLNLWRMTFLRHPYVSFKAVTNRKIVKVVLLYLGFYTLLGTEHVFEHTYAAALLGFDTTNIADLNWYVLAGIVSGIAFTYFTFARRRWRYKTMVAIAFALAVAYLAWFYFTIDYNIEKEMLWLPLFCRGAGAVILSTVLLTAVVQSGMPFMEFPQGLVINGFFGAVFSVTLPPALIGELLQHLQAYNAAWLSSAFTHSSQVPVPQAFGLVQTQALIVSMKEIYGLLLTAGIAMLTAILLSYAPIRPSAYLPKWHNIRRILRRVVRDESRYSDEISQTV